MSEHVNEVSDSNFETDVLKSDKPVLVDFWAAVVRALPDARADGRGGGGEVRRDARVVKLNVDDNPTSRSVRHQRHPDADPLQERQGRGARRRRDLEGRHLAHDRQARQQRRAA